MLSLIWDTYEQQQQQQQQQQKRVMSDEVKKSFLGDNNRICI